MGRHTQTGLVAAASVADYDTNRIRKHEFTRPDKEDDRVRQIEALNAQTGPVLLAYPDATRPTNCLAQRIKRARRSPTSPPMTAFATRSGVVDEATAIAAITAAFDAMPALYIADGHHRSAAASRVAAARRGQAGQRASADYFLAVIFPHHQMRIIDYNRVVTDLNGLSRRADFLARLSASFAVDVGCGRRSSRSARGVRPLCRRALVPPGHPARAWYRAGSGARASMSRLLVRPPARPDPRHRRPAPRHAHRLRRRHPRPGANCEQRVDSGEMAVAFAMHPTHMDDLMAVADAGQVMPPKSTWFEPKLADGLVSHVLD